jgi:CRISPR-associated endonuclease Cas1
MNLPLTNTTSQNDNDNAWAERGEYWQKKLNPVPQYKARKRRILHKPLVLSGHGIRLNIDRGTLLIKCGFTHYPQEREEHRFFPRDRQLPSRIVILDGDGSITFDALQWLSAQGVALVQINWQGHLASIGQADYAANPDLVKRQLEIRDNGEGFEFSKWLILKKIENCHETIKRISDNSPEGELILQKIEAQILALKKNPPVNLNSLLAVEGIAAAAYFRYWYTLSLKWKGLGRKPVPQEWLRVGTRIGSNDSNQFALHPVNAILNYVYAVLENQVRGQILAMGIDPTISYMHSSGNNRPSLVFDLMEPVRPVMDQKVLDFVIKHTFSPDDFILNKNGICRLHPQFARVIVKLVQDMPEIETITAANLKKLFGGNISKKAVNSQNSPELSIVNNSI